MTKSNDLLSSLVNQFQEGIEEHIRKSKVPEAVKWIENNFYIPETRKDPKLNGRFVLQSYQRDAIREALSRDDNGNYKYSIIVWSDIKKSAKSTIAAAVNLYRAHHTDWGEFYVIANDLKQADSRVNYYLRRALMLNPKFTEKYTRLGYRTTAPTGSFIEAIPIDPSGEAGSNADMITFCLDEQTDVLTAAGWKKGVDLTRFDEIATYGDGGRVTWERPTALFKEPFFGNLHTYDNPHFSLWCTADHRLYGRYSYSGERAGKDKYDRVGVMRSQELRNSGYAYYHPVSTVIDVQRSITPPEYVYLPSTKFHSEKYIPWKDWAAFLGVYLTEGSTSDFRGVPVHVRISQLREPHPEKYDQIFSILQRCFGDWVKINKKDGFKISSTELAKITKQFGTTWNKRVPRAIIESSKPVLENFLDGYILGDGHTPKNSNSVQITCASKGMADDLQEICVRLGYRSSVRPHDNKYWRVGILKGSVSVSVHKDNWKEVPYTGLVWCPTVSTGLFLARRDGRVFVTGNSELWGANEQEKQNMWAELTLSPTKRGQSFRWVESYAGFQEESELLYSLYDLGVLRGELLWPDRLYAVTDGSPAPLELFVNREAGMLCLWNTKPRCPWQVKEYYASEEKILPVNQFLRMHRNQWVTSTETFVPMEWWDACAHSDADWPKYDKQRHPQVIALDAAVSDDTFGVWMGCRHPQRAGEVMTTFVQRWKPVQGHKVDFRGTEEKPGPELTIRRLIKDYNVVEVTYDPYQLHDMATRLKQEGLAWFKSFDQGADRLTADSQFRTLIRERRFWHNGDPDFREHVQNSNAKVDIEDRRLRIVKRMEKMKIDLCVAASMGSHEIMRLNL